MSAVNQKLSFLCPSDFRFIAQKIVSINSMRHKGIISESAIINWPIAFDLLFYKLASSQERHCILRSQALVFRFVET